MTSEIIIEKGHIYAYTISNTIALSLNNGDTLTRHNKKYTVLHKNIDLVRDKVEIIVKEY